MPVDRCDDDDNDDDDGSGRSFVSMLSLLRSFFFPCSSTPFKMKLFQHHSSLYSLNYTNKGRMFLLRPTFNSNEDLISHLKREQYLRSPKIEKAMLSIDRKFFTPTSPYEDAPQYLGYGATISAPHMHSLTLDLLSDFLKPGMKVLDIGYGSGYLTTCFAELVGETGVVYGIEFVPEIANLGKENIRKFEEAQSSSDFSKLGRIILKEDNGWKGWQEYAPFNCIVSYICRVFFQIKSTIILTKA